MNLNITLFQFIKSNWYFYFFLFVYLIYVSNTEGDFNMFMSTCDHLLNKENIYYDNGTHNLY
jgi:hypothetical protein